MESAFYLEIYGEPLGLHNTAGEMFLFFSPNTAVKPAAAVHFERTALPKSYSVMDYFYFFGTPDSIYPHVSHLFFFTGHNPPPYMPSISSLHVYRSSTCKTNTTCGKQTASVSITFPARERSGTTDVNHSPLPLPLLENTSPSNLSRPGGGKWRMKSL